MDQQQTIAGDDGQDLRALLGAALARIEQLEATVSKLTQSVADPAGDAVGRLGLVDPTEGTIGRRHALKGAVLAAGAAAAGLVLSDAQPAAAADGANLIVGSVNQTATSPTGVAIGGTAATYGFGMTDNTRPGSDVRPCLTGHARGSNFDAAIEALAENNATGIYVKSQNASAVTAQTSGAFPAISATSSGTVGVRGSSTSGTGIQGASGSGTGVDGSSSTSWGVRGVSASHIGVFGQATGSNTTGVSGLGGSNGVGVSGYSDSGTGLAAATSAGTALTASAGRFGTGIFVAGGLALLRLAASYSYPRSAPTSDTFAHKSGDVVAADSGDLWFCTAAGTPGKWRKVAGPATAGSFHVLPAPARIYDSRTGTTPASVGPKSPMPAGGTRVLDCSANSSGVPLGATAVSLTILLVNASNGNGNFTVWANGVAKPTANTMVWGAGSGRWTASTITAIDSAAKIQVSASARTDLVLDVVGYYR